MNKGSFKVYIDESGDEGFVFLPNEQGSSRWLVLSAVVVRKSSDLEIVQLAKDVRKLLRKDERAALHFRNLKHEQRLPYVRAIGSARLKTVSVLIHKPSIAAPEIFQNESFRLYRYATRLLLERVSWLCRDHRAKDDPEGSADLIFSNRSAMSYDDLRGYLQKLKAKGDVVNIDWSVIDPTRVRAVNHDQLAGLQIADAVASSLFFAVNKTQYGEVEPRYMLLLGPTIYRHSGLTKGYGLKLWPPGLSSKTETLEHLAEFERL